MIAGACLFNIRVVVDMMRMASLCVSSGTAAHLVPMFCAFDNSVLVSTPQNLIETRLIGTKSIGRQTGNHCLLYYQYGGDCHYQHDDDDDYHCYVTTVTKYS